MTRKVYLTIIWTITVLCIIGGSISHAFGFYLWFRDAIKPTSAVSSEQVRTTQTSAAGSLKKVSVRVKTADVIICTGGTECSVDWNGDADGQPELKLDDNKLEVVQKEWHPHKVMSGNHTLTLTIPADLAGYDLEVDSDMGDLEIRDLQAGKADITLHMGNIKLKETAFTDLDINAKLGNVEIEQNAAESVRLEADMGNIDVTLGSFDRFDAEANLGNVMLKTDLSADALALDLDTDLGDVRVNGEKTGKLRSGSGIRVEMNSNMGDVSLTTG